MAVLYNKGRREWVFAKGEKPLKPGEERSMKTGVAEKFQERYPREFKVITVEKKEDAKIEISADVKAIIKETKGLRIKSAVILFDEKKAFTEDEQLKVLEELQDSE
ncbi:MAG: hypothetical protein KAS39_01070 [Actinomycetia bacterium]|nr:hypothetical protein [Actinomycetes bacterium]